MNWRSLWLIISTALLFCVGLLMIFNTTSAELIDRGVSENIHGVFRKQFLYGAVGVFLGCLAYRIGYVRLIRYSGWLLVGMTGVLALLFLPGVGQVVNGARRWIVLFGISFQPSESIKLLIPVYYIHWYVTQGKVDARGFLRLIGLLCIPIGLILFEPDHGTTAIILVTLVALFFLTKISWMYWALPLALLVGIGGSVAYQTPYVRGRMAVYLHPELDLKGKGHQPHQAKIAAGSGQLFGRGLGESLQKLNYLPEARNDYIAAIFAEETGFIGVTSLIGLYIVFACAGFFTAMKALDEKGFLLAAILTFIISIQAFLNLGIVSGLLPSKGMTLPFFSQGGTSLIANTIALFVLLDIARREKKRSTI
ncbi:MAG: putative peptidoglycan glycosyltransferase FtsW [Chlamydiales bacterium]|nr:putative peptidoglycan glycosyltransferase FtsW [Chlamydiales bacterium]